MDIQADNLNIAKCTYSNISGVNNEMLMPYLDLFIYFNINKLIFLFSGTLLNESSYGILREHVYD